MRSSVLKAIKVIDADYGPLKGRFGQGLLLDINSSIVVAVGPNSGGKTALLRLLATSLEFSRHYQMYRISQFWDGIKAHIKMLREAQEAPKGWFHFDIGHYINSELIGLINSRLGMDLQSHMKLIENFDRRGNGPARFPQYPTISFYAISKEGRNFVLDLERQLKEPTDLNVWGFVKPTISGEGDIFIQYLGLPKEHNDVQAEQIGLRAQIKFDQEYYFQEVSPGLAQNARLKRFFRDIRAFFAKHNNPVWRPKNQMPLVQRFMDPAADPERIVEDMYQDKRHFNGKQNFEKVPCGSRLCVFMDEPTTYLDPVNRLKFIQQMLKLVERFPGRLQFFIATNDDLHAHLRDRAVYIDLYAQPPVSSTSLELDRYVK